MTAWLLIFSIGAHNFIGGEYQDLTQCRAAAAHQLPHWRETYHRKVWWRCKYGYD